MPRLPENLFEQWTDGKKITAADYNREREIMRVAINDFNTDVEDILEMKTGPQGTGFKYTWDGTKLGIRLETEPLYQYVDLKGEKGDNLEFQWDGTKLGIRVEGSPSFSFVELIGPKGEKGDPGTSGEDIVQQDTPPEGIIEGRLWLDTSDNTFQETMFEGLEEEINTLKTSLNGKTAQATPSTTEKTDLVGMINEVFQSGNNVKANTVSALLSKDSSLPIDTGSSWTDVVNSINTLQTGINAGNNSLYLFSDNILTNATSYVKMKEIKFNVSGTIRITFDLASTDANVTAATVYGRVYKNDVPIGEEKVGEGFYYEDVPIQKGDKIALYMKIGGEIPLGYKAELNELELGIEELPVFQVLL